MDLCVYGAGAVGGYLAARLAAAGKHRVSVIGRGVHLAAIRARGLALETPSGTDRVVFAAAEDSPERLPPQDIVFVTLKSHSLPSIAAHVRRLLKPEGHAVFATNGIPWWWNHRANTNHAAPLRVDPESLLANLLGVERAIGCVVYSINEVIAPGTVVHRGNNRWMLGEPNDWHTPRLAATADALRQAGLNAEACTDLRREIWMKLLRNTPFNSLCALTRLRADQFSQELAALAQALTDEVRATAQAKGTSLPEAKAMDVIATGGAMRSGSAPRTTPSMLQDVLAGRPMEVEAIVGQVREFAREEHVRTPALDLVDTLLRSLDLSLRFPLP